MPAEGVINKFRLLHGDVSWERTDGSPVADLDSPIYYSSASRIFMGPVSGGGGGGGSFSLGVSTGGNTAGQTGVTGTRVVLAGGGEITLSQVTGPAGATISVSAPPQSVQTQSRFNLTLGGNTDGVLQEVSSGTLTLAGGANITLSQNGNAITISGPDPGTAQTNQTLGLFADGNTTGQSSSTTRDARSISLRGDGAVSVGFSAGSIRISAPVQSVQPETQTFVGGVAASDATFTSGTVALVALGNVTVRSTTGQQIQISVPAQSVQPETQTFLGGISASDTLYTSGTVRITGVGGGVTVSSNTGQRIDISVAAPVAQTGTQFSAGISGGNTSGASGTVAGRLVLVGGNRITLSGSTNGSSITVTISAPNAQTGISSIAASNATYTSGQVEFTGSGIVTIRSSAGQRVVVDASQSAQTQDRFNLTLSGNTAGVMAQVSSGTLTLAGGNNITVSQNGNAITISGANIGGAQTGISGIANSQTTYTSGTVSLSELGAITIRSTTGNQFQLSVDPQSNQTLGLYALGNTTGQSSSTTRDARSISVEGAGIVSVGYSGGSLRISAVQSVQPETQTFIGGISASDTLYTSGTVRITGVGGGVTVSSNTGQRIDISVAAQTGTQFSAGISGGNTAGDTGTVAGRVVLAGGANVTLSGSTNGASETISIVGPPSFSGGISGGNTSGQTGATGTRLVFAGGNNITLSGATDANGGTVTISGPNVGGAQTGISGIIASDATYTSGTVQFTGSNMVTVKSSAGQRVVIDATQSVQPGIQNLVASDATFSSGTVSISGFGAATVNTAANLIRISVPVQSVQPETQTFIGGISASDTLYTSGTVRFTGVGGGVTVSSNTGQRVDISVAAQTEQTQSRFNLTITGNTAGAGALVSSGVLSLAGGNNITLSQAGNAITISGASQSAESQSIGMSNLGNTSGTTGIASGAQIRMLFAGVGAVTLSQSLNGASGTLSISAPAQTVESQSIGMSNIGNTSGTTGIASGAQVRMLFAGGNNVTLSQSLNGASGTITISAASQTNQTLGMYAVQNTTGQSSSTTMDARTLSVAGDGAVSVGYSGGSLRISAPVQTGTQFSAGISGGNTAGDTGTVAGRVVLAGGANITLSGSTNGASETISIIGGAGGAGFSAGVSTDGNTAGATGVSGTRMVLVGSGVMSLSQTTGAAGNTVSILAPPASVISAVAPLSTSTNGSTISILGPAQLSVGFSTQGNTSGNTGFVTGQLALVGSNGITLSGSTNGGSQTITLSGITQSVESQSIGMSNVGNTSGTTGMASGGQVRFLFAGGNNITLSQSLNGASGTITISAPNLGAGAMSAGVSNLGNSAGATGITGTQLVLAGGNNITLSQTTGANGGTVSIIGGAGGGFSAGASNLGNTAGSTGITGTRLVMVGTNAISLSQSTDANGGTLSINAPATSSLVGTGGLTISSAGSTISIQGTTRSEYAPHSNAVIATGQQGQGTLHIQPVNFPNVQHDRWFIGLNMSNATNSSNSITISAWVGLFTKNASSISLVSSISVSTNFTGSGTAGSYSLYGGSKWLSIPWTNTITEGDYYIGINVRTTTGGGAGHSISQLLASRLTNVAWSGVVGVGSNATEQYILGNGVYSVSTAGIPAAIGFTEINGSGTLVLRPPVFALRSGTV